MPESVKPPSRKYYSFLPAFSFFVQFLILFFKHGLLNLNIMLFFSFVIPEVA